MINIMKNLENSALEVFSDDDNLLLNFKSSCEDCFKLSIDSSLNLDINVIENSNNELFNEIVSDSKELSLNIKGRVNGFLRQIILVKSKIENLKIDATVEVNKGNYELIILDFNNGNVLFNNKIETLQESAETNLLCASVVNENYNKNITNNLINKAKNTICNMDNYGVSFDTGKLHIKGIGEIVKNASKSSNIQKCTMYVLDEKSKVTCEPFLFIDEDDVSASHANALGQIDTNALFYLCSRGIEIQRARKMIVLGYFKSYVEKIKSIDLINYIQNYIEEVIKNV